MKEVATTTALVGMTGLLVAALVCAAGNVRQGGLTRQAVRTGQVPRCAPLPPGDARMCWREGGPR